MSSRKMKYVDIETGADRDAENVPPANPSANRMFKRARTEEEMVVDGDDVRIDCAFEKCDADGKMIAGLAVEVAETAVTVERLSASLKTTQKYTSKTMYKVAELYNRMESAETAVDLLTASNAALESRLDAAEKRAAETIGSLAQVRHVMSAYTDDTEVFMTYVFIACAVAASCIAVIIAAVKLQ
jgi:uncharacterized coiled-coil protein SlyX